LEDDRQECLSYRFFSKRLINICGAVIEIARPVVSAGSIPRTWVACGKARAMVLAAVTVKIPLSNREEGLLARGVNFYGIHQLETQRCLGKNLGWPTAC